MTINPEINIKLIINVLERIKTKLQYILNNSELDTFTLVQGVKQLEVEYSKAVAAYQDLGNAGMTTSEIAGAFADFVYPAPTPGSTFTSINQAKNAFITSYQNNVWPLFEGKTVDLVSGNHIDVDIIKPAAFNTATQNFLNAIGALIKVT